MDSVHDIDVDPPGGIAFHSPEAILEDWLQRRRFRADNGLNRDDEEASTDDEESPTQNLAESDGDDDDDEDTVFPIWEEVLRGSGLSAWDELKGAYEKEAALVQKLSAYDRAICRAFSFKLQTNLTDKGYAKAPLAFNSDPPLPKLPGLRTRVAFLSGFKPEQYDCCINSCCCFTGPNHSLTKCPHCDEPRHQPNGKSQNHFTYIPLIPRLLSCFRDKEKAKQMQYRAEHQSQPDKVTDIFDGTCYQELLERKVSFDGVDSDYHFFSGKRDIALGLSTDGFSPFKRRKQTAW
ncbi:hypothetical protein BDN72DRAFT_773359, partial [Pluteus cervinus]